LGKFQTVADVLPVALVSSPTPVVPKDRTVPDARPDAASNIKPAPAKSDKSVKSKKATRKIRPRWLEWWTPTKAAFTVATVIALIALLTWNISLQLKLANQQNEDSKQTVLADAISSASLIFQLPGTDEAPAANGILVLQPDGMEALLFVRGMPEAPEGSEYQLWNITEFGPEPVGAFGPDLDTDHMVTFEYDFFNAEAVGVSIEPIGEGSEEPTGPIIFLGAR
jgi:anti-sigma-K factor RskA